MLAARLLFVLSTGTPLCTWLHLLYAYLLWYLCYGIAARICRQKVKICKAVNRTSYTSGCAFSVLSVAVMAMLLLPFAAYIRILTMLQSRWTVQKVYWRGVPKAASALRRNVCRQRWKAEASYLKTIRHRSSRHRASLLLWYRWTLWCSERTPRCPLSSCLL